MTKKIVLVGAIGSGKDTVTQILVEEYGYTQESFAAALKDVCSAVFNWPRDLIEGKTPYSRHWREQVDSWWAEKLGIPNFTPRYALNNIGTELFRKHFNEDIWILSLENRLTERSKDVVISDARFKNELMSQKRTNAIFVEVRRHPKPVWWDHAVIASASDELTESHHVLDRLGVHESEWSWASFTPDIVIDNTGTIEDLHNEVKEKLCF